MSWRVFWRILFDVINGVPRLQLEMTLYDFSSGVNRLGRSVTDLTPVPVGTVHFVNDRAVFFGGYIESEVDLNTIAQDLLISAGIDTGNQLVLEHLSESINGENVSIRVDAVLYEKSGKTEFPLFHFPQPDKEEVPISGVNLVESISTAGDRNISWEISGQGHMSSSSFSLETFDGQHGVRVRQDEGSSSDVFEFLVDSIPLGDSNTDRTHAFTGELQTFIIGGTPAQPDGLFGEIVHLDFDPNNNCGNCAG